VNTGELEYVLIRAERRVLEIQTKLHRWAREDPHRRFSDLFNLDADPTFLLVVWVRVRGNKGARTAGVDGETAYYVETVRGGEYFFGGLRSSLKDRSFCPLPVRERMIPKADGKKRRLGIATVTDRMVQASLKLVLEPTFEAEFLPCSHRFRPNHRAHDAVAEVRHFTSHSYEWIVEGDIKACFDEISHAALMDRVRARVGDKRALALMKAFLKAAIVGEDRAFRETSTWNPARVNPLPVAQQRGPLCPGRAHCPRAGRSSEHLQGLADVPAARAALRGVGRVHPQTAPRPCEPCTRGPGAAGPPSG
jgi:RNA-directed DNA polymerase